MFRLYVFAEFASKDPLRMWGIGWFFQRDM
jgi:hypothetical protein